jgi:hypothetical protein
MVPERQSWPDTDGTPVAVGDWVEVFCSWTRAPKFEGRPVQVVGILRGGTGTVFCLRDPSTGIPHQYLLADGHGYRRVHGPELN